MAQRVMDCGDAGHILLSKRVADDLEQYPQWRPYLHEFGECEVNTASAFTRSISIGTNWETRRHQRLLLIRYEGPLTSAMPLTPARLTRSDVRSTSE